MNLALSRRLLAAADFVRPGAVVADVGCDHGKLSAFLLQSEKVPFVYAGDLRPKPLAKARQLLAEFGLSARCRCLCTDGLDGMPQQEIQDVVIAGLGFDVTAGIIRRAPWLRQPDCRLVLVPASKHDRTRRFLAAEGFQTLQERAVCEAGHCYTVMQLVFDDERRTLNEWQAQLGKLCLEQPEEQRYLRAVLARMRRVQAAAAGRDTPGSRAADEFLQQYARFAEAQSGKREKRTC